MRPQPRRKDSATTSGDAHHGLCFLHTRKCPGKSPRSQSRAPHCPPEVRRSDPCCLNVLAVRALSRVSGASHRHGPMSAIGTKRTFVIALHMSAFGGKADIALTFRNVR